jgi:hypothetical protein
VTRRQLLSKATQVLAAIGVALSVGVAGPAAPASASYPDFQVKFDEGQTTLATTRQTFEFGVSFTDVSSGTDTSEGTLIISVPAAFSGVEILGSGELKCKVFPKETPAADSIVGCSSAAVGVDPYGDRLRLRAVAPPTAGRFKIHASMNTGFFSGPPVINPEDDTADLLVIVGSGLVAPVKTQPQRSR